VALACSLLAGFVVKYSKQVGPVRGHVVGFWRFVDAVSKP
jgi:hypothetical protein